MNDYFINIIKAQIWKPYKCSHAMNINEAVLKFDNSGSIKRIKEYFLDASKTNFNF